MNKEFCGIPDVKDIDVFEGKEKVIGQTASSGFQVGARRTFDLTLERAWELLFSRSGVGLWLGEVSEFAPVKGFEYYTAAGITGIIRVVNPQVNIRMTWKPKDWNKASTLQIRTIPVSKDKTTISFHQENLQNAVVRQKMHDYWHEVLNNISYLIFNE